MEHYPNTVPMKRRFDFDAFDKMCGDVLGDEQQSTPDQTPTPKNPGEIGGVACIFTLRDEVLPDDAA